MFTRRPARFGALAFSLCAGAAALAQTVPPPSAIDHPVQPRSDPSAAERKLTTRLRFALQAAAADRPSDPQTPAEGAARHRSSDDALKIEIACTVGPDLIRAIESQGGVVVEQSSRWGVVIATVPASAVLAIAARDDVRRVTLPPRARVNAP